MENLCCFVDLKLSKLDAMRKTINALEQSLGLSRALETEQLSRYSLLKIQNWSLSDELRDADNRNKNMLSTWQQMERLSLRLKTIRLCTGFSTLSSTNFFNA